MKFKQILQKISFGIIGGRELIGKYNIKISRNHSLPSILREYPDYGSNLVRLARIVKNKSNPLKIIDVGGNIGDTVAMLLSDDPNYIIHSIEGDNKYYNILCKNFDGVKSVSTYKNFLSDKDTVIVTTSDRTKGTLRLNANKNTVGKEVSLTRLDTLISANLAIGDAHLIKIDTDGYDNQILSGAKKYLSKEKPVIFFEYDSRLLKQNGQNGIDVFSFLEKMDYQTIIFFDNYGRFLISINISNKDNINQLDRYIKTGNAAFPYYDIVAFHKDDSDLSKIYVYSETNI